MPRNITVTFEDGSTHVYQNTPDDVTPEQVTVRASKEFGKSVSALDGGRERPKSTDPTSRGGARVAPVAPASPQNLIATGGAGGAGGDPRVLEAMGGGRAQRLFTQGAMTGAANVGDALLNTPNRIWNLLGIPVGAAATEMGLPAFEPAPDYPFLSQFAKRGLTPTTAGERFAETTGEYVGSTAAGGGIRPDMLGRSLASAAGAGVGAQTAREVAPGNPLAEVFGSVVGGQAANRIANLPGQTQRLYRAATGKDLPGPAGEIVRQGEQAGVRVMTSDVSPPTTRTGRFAQMSGEGVPIIGTGGRRAAQQVEREGAVQKALDSYGAGHGQDFSKAIAQDLLKRKGEQVAKYSGLKESIKTQLQGRNVVTSNTVSQIDDEIAALQKVFKGGEAESTIAELQSLRASAQGQGLDGLEQVRKVFGETLANPNNAGIKSVLDKGRDRIYSAINKDEVAFIGEAAGPAAVKQWRLANARLSSMIDEAQNTSLGQVLNKAEATPEAVKQMLSSAKPSDVRRLYRNMTETGRAAARSAIMQKAYDASFRNNQFSSDAFMTNLAKEMKTSGQFFDKAQKRQLEGLSRLLSATARAGQAGVMTNTGAQTVLPATLSTLIGATGGAPAGVASFATIGGLARAYESKPVRNFLIRLAAMKPDQAAKEAEKLIPMMQVPAQQVGQQ